MNGELLEVRNIVALDVGEGGGAKGTVDQNGPDEMGVCFGNEANSVLDPLRGHGFSLINPIEIPAALPQRTVGSVNQLRQSGDGVVVMERPD